MRNITAVDYNEIQSKLSSVLGNGSGQFGYGQNLKSSRAKLKDQVTALQINNLIDDMNVIYQHQNGINAPDIEKVNVGDLVDDALYSSILEVVNQLYNNKHNISSGTTEEKLSSVRTTPWGQTKHLRRDVATVISVIDEISPSADTIRSDWVSFRKKYPNRMFYLLDVNSLSGIPLKIPPEFANDSNAFVRNVNRDNGDTSLITDWFAITNLGQLPAGSVVALSIDVSGSMDVASVQASYNYFKLKVQQADLVLSEQTFGNERWALVHNRTLPEPSYPLAVVPSNKLQHEFSVLFANSDARRHFFNSGGNIQIQSNIVGGTVGNLIKNGSFEDVSGMSPTSYGFTGTGEIPGWASDALNNRFEVYVADRFGQRATNGEKWINFGPSSDGFSMYQNTQGVVSEESYQLKFDAGDPSGYNNTLKVYWSGALVGTITPPNGTMASYSYTVTGGSGNGSNRLAFVSEGPVTDKYGVALDNVTLVGPISEDISSGPAAKTEIWKRTLANVGTVVFDHSNVTSAGGIPATPVVNNFNLTSEYKTIFVSTSSESLEPCMSHQVSSADGMGMYTANAEFGLEFSNDFGSPTSTSNTLVVYDIDFGSNVGTCGIVYDASSVDPNSFTIEWNGQKYSTGDVTGRGQLLFNKNAMYPTTATVTIEAGGYDTFWNFSKICPPDQEQVAKYSIQAKGAQDSSTISFLVEYEDSGLVDNEGTINGTLTSTVSHLRAVGAVTVPSPIYKNLKTLM